jgi:hypothetical protein
MSYAWPSEKKQRKKCWVQPFLKNLYDHLVNVGIKTKRDLKDIGPDHITKSELNIILAKTEGNQWQHSKSKIYPMLISGTMKTSFPDYPKSLVLWVKQ